ncbi:MAG: 50S ribosomal protein L15 [Anaerolineae bacterium]
MRLHDLGPAKGAGKKRRRIARGNSGRGGTYAGRGRKGQKARAGGGKAPYFEGGQLPFVRRLPFKRGFKNIFRVEYTPVGVAVLDERFDDGDTVTPEALVDAGVLRHVDEPYKVLAGGEITKALTVQAPRFSGAARADIEAAGGSCSDLADDYRRAGMGRSHRRHR